VLLHSDMVQSFGKIDTDVSLVDAASFAAHKFYGPKGVGFLYLRSGLSIQPIMFGGAHENERRPGTENVAAIAGMAAAAEWTLRDCESEQEREGQLRDELWTRISQNVPDAKQNAANALRLLGLDHTRLIFKFQGRDFRLTDVSGRVIEKLIA